MSQMNLALKDMFLKLWKEYFDGAELPIAFYYTDEEKVAENDPATSGQCLIENLVKVRQGTPLRFGVDSIGCPGGRRYAGFSGTLSENFEYFLSCGIPGIMEGERYKKSPELVREVMKRFPEFKAPNKFIVFKRWDQLDESDEPEVVIFFAKPDVLAGLFTLANFDEIEEGVIAPFGSGCSSIILHPYLEGENNPTRCVLGMFDISARPHVHSDIQTFAVPIAKFDRMVEDIQESFLITATWEKIRKRITPS
jgi:uncharacterized protein (DUF169 family)